MKKNYKNSLTIEQYKGRRASHLKSRNLPSLPGEYISDEARFEGIKKYIEGGRLIIEFNLDEMQADLELGNNKYLIQPLCNLYNSGEILDLKINSFNWNVRAEFDQFVELRRDLVESAKPQELAEIPSNRTVTLYRKQKQVKIGGSFSCPITYHEHNYIGER